MGDSIGHEKLRIVGGKRCQRLRVVKGGGAEVDGTRAPRLLREVHNDGRCNC